ncbi:MAG TPA: amidohydrolase family protein [Actinomycetota bacterium]|nr:amidohydrolase family protein [Actinomycetota bacterium]
MALLTEARASTTLLDDVPVVDNHCHGFVSVPDDITPPRWRAFFTESREERTRSTHAATMVSYRRVMHRLAGLLRCEPSEDEVVAARARLGERKAIGMLLHDANAAALLVDRGYPPPAEVLPDDEVRQATDVRIESLLRLEPLFEELIRDHASVADVVDALRARLYDLRAQGFVGLKSVAAYRTGLDVSEWPPEEVARHLAEARSQQDGTGGYRLASKPLLEHLLLEALSEASRQELPVQFHVGYGDTDVDLLRGNPLWLRPWLGDERLRGMTFVLLHECYPYTREGAYLASVYDNVYLDLSYGIPFLGWAEMLDFTRAAVAVAPLSKLLYSSDGVGVPELHWASAHDARTVLGEVLEECRARGELTPEEARRAGEDILCENARRLYGLG